MYFIIKADLIVWQIIVCVFSAAEKTNRVSGGPAADQSGQEERGDLIQFYNSIYVLKMKSFALRYATNDNRVRLSAVSPVIHNGNLF